MIKVGIVGGTGYTGIELLRLLAQHPNVAITAVTSRTDVDALVESVYPSLRGYVDDLRFCLPEVDHLLDCDLVFFATPNGIAMQMARELRLHDIKLIDLSADFRLQDIGLWEIWYGLSHLCPELAQQAVYGLPELNALEIETADLIACPGCYPTAITLGFLPLLENDLIDTTCLIADAKSGTSGAGRKAEVETLLSETGESFKAYAVSGHRHLPEITRNLEQIAQKNVQLTFVPHLTPMIRGIHATLYAQLTGDATPAQLQEIFEHRYINEPFVDVLPFGSHPDTRNVRGSNRCQIALHLPQGGKTLVVLSVIDNLVKGAAGQAVQAMNLRFGFPQTQGLTSIALYP